jgi:hypothetical protein
VPCNGVLHKVAMNVEPASWSEIVVQTLTVESCFVVIAVAKTVGECGRVLMITGTFVVTQSPVLSQTFTHILSVPA